MTTSTGVKGHHVLLHDTATNRLTHVSTETRLMWHKTDLLTILRCSNSVLVSVSTILCNHHPYPIPEYFHHFEKKPCTRKKSCTNSNLPSPGNHKASAVPQHQPILNTSYKWNQAIGSLLCLACFTRDMMIRFPHAAVFSRFRSFLRQKSAECVNMADLGRSGRWTFRTVATRESVLRTNWESNGCRMENCH